MAVLTEEQTMLRDMAHDWVRDRAPVAAFRRTAHEGVGFDPALWTEMGAMGWAGMLVPEAQGGADFGHVGLGLVLEALGRTLVASPLLSTALIGAWAFRQSGGGAQQGHWLPRIAAGEVVVALALEEQGRHDPADIAFAARSDGDAWLLEGVKAPVLDAGAADLFLVVARGGDGATLLLAVPRDAPGLSVERLQRIDGRDAGLLRFDGVSVRADAVLSDDPLVLERVLDAARAGLAAEMLGTASQAFETTLDYLKTRVQFGQLIGSFQALQHRVVAVQAELVMTRSAVEAALQALDEGHEDVAMLVSLAKAQAGETLWLAAREMVQMHGGIGMTEEHDAGLYYKRAAVADATWGNAAFHRERYARLAGY